MNKERVEDLKTILHNVPVKKFNMNEWECDTSGCALGHAAMAPTFIKQGLYVYDAGVYFEGTEGFHAAEKFFDLSANHARFLFDPDTWKQSWSTKPINSIIGGTYKLSSKVKMTWYRENPDALYADYARDIEPKHVIERIDWLLGRVK